MSSFIPCLRLRKETANHTGEQEASGSFTAGTAYKQKVAQRQDARGRKNIKTQTS